MRNKQNAVIRLGMRQDMVAPIWQGITLIPDEVTLASKNGQIQLTAVMLHAVKLLRAGRLLQTAVSTRLDHGSHDLNRGTRGSDPCPHGQQRARE